MDNITRNLIDGRRRRHLAVGRRRREVNRAHWIGWWLGTVTGILLAATVWAATVALGTK